MFTAQEKDLSKESTDKETRGNKRFYAIDKREASTLPIQKSIWRLGAGSEVGVVKRKCRACQCWRVVERGHLRSCFCSILETWRTPVGRCVDSMSRGNLCHRGQAEPRKVTRPKRWDGCPLWLNIPAFGSSKGFQMIPMFPRVVHTMHRYGICVSHVEL